MAYVILCFFGIYIFYFIKFGQWFSFYFSRPYLLLNYYISSYFYIFIFKFIFCVLHIYFLLFSQFVRLSFVCFHQHFCSFGHNYAIYFGNLALDGVYAIILSLFWSGRMAACKFFVLGISFMLLFLRVFINN